MRKIKFQDDTIENISNFFKKENSETAWLNSPTGSGKSFMVSRILDNLAEEFKYSFIFISPSTGDLLTQGFEKITSTSNMLNCEILDAGNVDSFDKISVNECVFIGWEKMKNKNKDTGENKNKLMKDSEHGNLMEILGRTNNEIVLVIDESHIGHNTERTNEIISLINPSKLLFVSATSKINVSSLEIQKGRTWVENVAIDEVRKSGLIKSWVALNMINEKDILRSAFNKLEELQGQYIACGLKHKPLLLIQISNGTKGKENLDFLKTYISDNFSKLKFDEYLSETKNESKKKIRETIEGADSEIDILFFKQAIATGWDIPRAHILLKYRNSGSETLDVQTLGRILRVINGDSEKLQNGKDMNTAFIYTTADKYKLEWDEVGVKENIIKDLTTEVKEEYRGLSLKSFNRIRNNFNDIKNDFLSFDKSLEIKSEQNIELNKSVLGESEFKISETDVKNKHQDIHIDSQMISNMLDSALKSVLKETIFSPSRSFRKLRKKVLMDLKVPGQKNQDAAKTLIKRWSTGAREEVLNLVKSYEKEYTKNNNEIKETIWKATTEEFSSADFKTYEYEKQNNIMKDILIQKNISDVERKISIYISRNYDYWYWNKEGSSNFFAVKKGEDKLHFPDFIAWKDGEAHVIEAKDGITLETSGSRAEALRNYTKSTGIKTYIATVDGEVINLNELI